MSKMKEIEGLDQFIDLLNEDGFIEYLALKGYLKTEQYKLQVDLFLF